MIRILQLILNHLVWSVFFCILGVAYFFTETTDGLQVATQIVAGHLPGKLRIGKLEGTLFSSFTFKDIYYDEPSMQVSIKSLHVNWNPEVLINYVLSINDLNLDEMSVKILSSSASSSIDYERYLTFANKHIAINHIAINHLKIAEDRSTSIIRLDGALTEKWNVTWQANIPDLTKLFTHVKGEIKSDGQISGARLTPDILATVQLNNYVHAKENIKHLNGKLNFTFKPNIPTYISLTGENIQVSDYKLKKVDLGLNGLVTLQNKVYQGDFNIELNKKPYLLFTISAPKTINFANYFTEAIIGKLKVNFPDIQVLKDYVPITSDLHGKIDGILDFNGTLAAPVVTGELNLRQGYMNIPKAGITLRNINVAIRGNQLRQFTYQGTVDSTSGQAKMTGSTNFAASGYPTNLTILGDRFQITNLSEYKIFVSPNLKIALSTQSISVTGSLGIPEAHITPKDFRQTVSLPQDVVFVNKKMTTATNLMAIVPNLQVSVILGKKVYIRYQDLEAFLQGNLFISKVPDGLITATGSLYTVDGTYKAYGKLLKIQEGRLIYTGGIINNPGLNIKAARDIKTAASESSSSFLANSAQVYEGEKNITVGVQILGTFDTPVFSVYSSPSMTRTNILSYLLLGVPESQLSGDNRSALLSAASALKLSGGSTPSKFTTITNKLQESLGLSELNVESVQTFDPTANHNVGAQVGTPSLVLGKQIAKNIYVHYSVSPFGNTPVNMLNLQYKFSKHWSIQSEASTIDTGADLLYSIERD